MEQIAAGALGAKTTRRLGPDSGNLRRKLMTKQIRKLQFILMLQTGRSIHTYHTKDAGGGHAHGTMKIAGEKNIRHPRPILLGHLLFIR
jgi:hypothetical protein